MRIIIRPMVIVTNYTNTIDSASKDVTRYPNVGHEVTAEMKHDLSIFFKKTLV